MFDVLAAVAAGLFDNVRSLGAKYDLVNRKGLRGTGIWALGFEGSRTELYTLLKQKFATS